MIRLTDILNEWWPFNKKQAPTKPVRRKAGDVWKTASGRWGARNKVRWHISNYFDTEEEARAYAVKKFPHVKQDDTQPTRIDKSSPAWQTLEKNKLRSKERLQKLAKGRKTKEDDAEDMTLINLIRQMETEPETKEKDDKFKFGGGGGFSGGGSSGRF